MNKIFLSRLILFVSIFSSGIYYSGISQTPFHQPEDWIPVFEDHFDKEVSEKWKVENEFDHYGEPQVYTNRPENVFIRNVSGNNFLVLKTFRENYECKRISPAGCNKLKYAYTSGWVETKRTYNVHYGYMEARIKIPEGKGIWPAFWTFRGEGVQNRHNSAEIDIFEMDGKRPAIQGTNLHLDYNAPNFKAPSFPEEIDIPDYSDDFHTYGLKWTPTNIYWYFDNREIRRSPNPGIVDPVRIILNVAIFPWELPDENTSFPTEFLVDFVKVYAYKKPEFILEWRDEDSGKINHAFLKKNDRIFKGDFINGDKKDELLIFFEDGKWAEMYSFQNGNWALKWSNRGQKNIGKWQLNPGDRYIIGDFTGDAKEELMIISGSYKISHLYSFDGKDWIFQWNNKKNGKIQQWRLNPKDRYFTGDFNKDGKDELLFISSKTKKMELYSFKGDDWSGSWKLMRNDKTENRFVKPGDTIIPGDFDGDGRDELVIVSATLKSAGLFSFNGTGWQNIWENNEDGKISDWFVKPDDQYLAGDFNRDGKDELFCLSDSANVQLFGFNGSDWKREWTNDGLGNLADISLNVPVPISISVGCFYESGRADIWLVKDPANNCGKISMGLIRYRILD
jgi:beta-glucanase (GH16 family)